MNWKNCQNGWNNCDRNFWDIYLSQNILRNALVDVIRWKKRQNFLVNTGVNKQTGYGLEKLVEYFVYGNHKALKLSEKPVFKHVL